MRFIVAIATAIGLFAAITAYGQEPKREYDRFKDQTAHDAKVELSSLDADKPEITLTLGATTKGDKPIGRTDKVTLTAMVTYNLSRPSGCTTGGVDALIDGKPISLEQAISPFFYGGHAIVTTSKELTYAQAQALANSKLAEFRTCGQVYALTPERLGAFKQMLAPAASNPTSP